jgi:histidinol-phosphate aminotransferase
LTRLSQVIVVTGSSRGIGRAVALACARAGAQVVLNGRNSAALARAVKQARRMGDAVGIHADASTLAGAEKLLKEALREFGRVDVLINNAAWAGPKPRQIWRLRPDDWRRALDVNTTGPFLCAAIFLRWMTARRRPGRIINVDSTAGARAYPGLAPYGISKSGLRALTAHLAVELEGTGIVVTGLELGQHRSEMTRTRLPRGEFRRLDGPETAVPLFLYALDAPPELTHGRTLSERRFRTDPAAEAALNSPLALCRPFTPQIARHRPGVKRSDVNLDLLENPLGAPARARKIRLGRVERYPDPHYTRLRGALSAKLGIPPDWFTFGTGSSELIERMLRLFTRPGDDVVSTSPTWPMFERFCRTLGVANRQVDVDRSGQIDLAKLTDAILLRTRLVYLVSPSNPLGPGIDRAAFIKFLDRVPPHLPLVVDEAYAEFSDRPDLLRVAELLATSNRPLIGVRTFSKYYGLAGLRVGYAFARPSTIDLLSRLELPFAVSSVAENAALAAIEDRAHASAVQRMIQNGSRQLRAGLAQLGLAALPSDASFLMAESPAPPDDVFDEMTKAGLHLPQVHWKRYIQLPIAGRDENRRMLAVLRRLQRQRR